MTAFARAIRAKGVGDAFPALPEAEGLRCAGREIASGFRLAGED